MGKNVITKLKWATLHVNYSIISKIFIYFLSVNNHICHSISDGHSKHYVCVHTAGLRLPSVYRQSRYNAKLLLNKRWRFNGGLTVFGIFKQYLFSDK